VRMVSGKDEATEAENCVRAEKFLLSTL